MDPPAPIRPPNIPAYEEPVPHSHDEDYRAPDQGYDGQDHGYDGPEPGYHPQEEQGFGGSEHYAEPAPEHYEEPAPEPIQEDRDEFELPLPPPPGQDPDERQLDSDSFESLPVPIIEGGETEASVDPVAELEPPEEESLEEKVRNSGGSVETGQVIYGSYIIEKEVGRGRSSTVYLAVHEANGQRVAVKIPHPERSGLKDRIRRLKREKDILKALTHPSIPRFIAGEMEGMSPYLMMGFAEGKALQSFIGKRSFSVKELKSIVLPICEALGEAHRMGVLHLGLNGQTVFVQDDWTPTVIGMSHLTQEHLDSESVLFLSPEQLSGETDKLGPHCDVWALGVLIYALLFGRFPVEMGSATAIAAKLMLEGVNPPDEKELKKAPTQLARACMAALTPTIEERPSIEEIHQILTGREPIAVGRWALRIGIAFVLIFALIWGLNYQTEVEPERTVANLAIGLPANYEPLWVYEKPDDLSPDVPNRWVLRRDSVSVASMPEITDRMRSVDRLRALRDLFTGKIVVDDKDKRRLKVVYDTPQSLTDVNPWVLQPLRPVFFRAQFPASQLRFKSGVVYGAQSCWSIGDGDAMGPLSFVVGGACWEEVKVTLECAGAAEEIIGLKIGSAPELVLHGPEGRATAGDAEAKAKIGLGWQKVSVSAGNEFGEDVQVGQARIRKFGSLFKKPMESGPVQMTLGRGTLKMKRLILEGIPVTTDVPALARVTERFRLNQSLRVETDLSFEEETIPGAAIFRFVYQGGRADVLLSKKKFRLVRDGRLVFSRDIDFSGGGVSLTVGYGRWRFLIQGNRPFWFLDGTFPKEGDLTLKLGSTGRRIAYKSLKVSGSRDKVELVQPFRGASKILDHWLNPNSDQQNWELSKVKMQTELGAVEGLVAPFYKDKDAFAVTAKGQTIVTRILQGKAEVDESLLEDSTEEIISRYGYDRSGTSNFIERMLEGFQLDAIAPEVALAAVTWGLQLKPDRADAKFLRARLRRDIALKMDDKNKRGEILKECLEDMNALLESEKDTRLAASERVRWLCERAWTLYLIGSVEKARQSLLGGELSKEKVLVAAYRARIEREEGRLKEARRLLFEALRLAPSEAVLFDELKIVVARLAKGETPKDLDSCVRLAVEAMVASFAAVSVEERIRFLKIARDAISTAKALDFSKDADKAKARDLQCLSALAYIDSLANRENTQVVDDARAKCRNQVFLGFAETRFAVMQGNNEEARKKFEALKGSIKNPLHQWLKELDPVLRAY